MKKVICLVMLVTLVGWAVAANDFQDGAGNGRWDDAGNWRLGTVPQDSTTNPGLVDPGWVQWNNDAAIQNGNTALIDSATTATAYGLKMGHDGAVSGVDMTGGSLTVGNWGMSIGRGGSGSVGSLGTFHMTDGVLNAPWIALPEQYDAATPGAIGGHWIMDGGTANANWLKLGGGSAAGAGTLELNGGTINLSDYFQIGGTLSSVDIEAGIMNIHHVDFEGSLQATIDEILGWAGAGYITAYDGAAGYSVGVSYDSLNENIVVEAIPEPATLSLLALGGLLLRRKKN